VRVTSRTTSPARICDECLGTPWCTTVAYISHIILLALLPVFSIRPGRHNTCQGILCDIIDWSRAGR
jgi:hypothetical protein